jgi:dolichol kinase
MEDKAQTQRSFGRTVVAVLIFLIAAWVLLGFVVHIVGALFSTIVIIAAVVAVVWALKVLL